jgi:hypothetical protein
VARYLSEYLESMGFRLETATVEGAAKSTSRLTAELARQNPAVPSPLKSLVFEVVATGSGCQILWVLPEKVENGDSLEPPKRFAREFVSHLARTISTTSRGSGRLTEVSPGRFPFVP